MKTSRRIAVTAAREVKRSVALAAMRTGRKAKSRGSPSLRPLTEAETEALLGGELLVAFIGVRRHA